ncbi:MAG: heme-copper oxidase subunit III [Candidatus Binatia bacterium]
MAHAHALSRHRLLPPHIRVVHSSPRQTGKQTQPAVPNAIIGILVFLAAEAMLFAGLISAFLVLRANSAGWPPPDQPRLPVEVTAVNTLILLLSAYTMHRAVQAIRTDRIRQLIWWLLRTGLLGMLFLTVQGAEWIRLVGYGLRINSSAYGATFYTVIGCHGLHAFGGLVVLLAVLWKALHGRYSARDHVAVEVCRLYWSFVVGIWPVLYVLVYLM